MKHVLMSLLLVWLASESRADEVITVDRRGKQTRHTGTITDIKGDRLTLQTPAGREQSFLLSIVQRFESEWSPTKQDADAKFAARDYPSALRLYRTAFAQEPRRWVKRQILARVVVCQRNTDRLADACSTFARLIQDDPDTPYFDVIPLQWESRPCPQEVVNTVRDWMPADQPPALRLVSASWLMVSRRDPSLATLRELGRHTSSEKVSRLAVAQLWRAELLTLKQPRIDWWHEQIESIPKELRGGAYFLLGESYARFDQADEAALAYLRVPLLYPHELRLAQRAYWRAAQALEQSNRKETVQLLRYAIQLGGKTEIGMQASAKLTELQP